MVVLPGAKVLVMGPLWDLNCLTPWVHDLAEDTWGNFLPTIPDQTAFEEACKSKKGRKPKKPEETRIPALKYQVQCGSALHLGDKVYLIGPCTNENFTICAILDLSTLDKWDYVCEDDTFKRNGALVMPCSSTEIAILGG